MSDTPNSDSSSNDPAMSESSPPPGMPRWLKVSGIVVLVVIVVVLVVQALIGGEHGPGLHQGMGAVDPLVIAHR